MLYVYLYITLLRACGRPVTVSRKKTPAERSADGSANFTAAVSSATSHVHSNSHLVLYSAGAAQLPTAVVPPGSPISHSAAPSSHPTRDERATGYLTLVVAVIPAPRALPEIYVRAWPPARDK